MIGTPDISTDIKWQEQNSGYFYSQQMPITGTLDICVNLKLQLQELWILVMFSSGNEKDF